LTSGDLVQRSLVLGNRSLLASEVPPHATSTSFPQVAPQATGTSLPQVGQHIAPQSDRHIAHCPKPTAMSTAYFSQLLSFINCYGVGIKLGTPMFVSLLTNIRGVPTSGMASPR
jgi:hypothetical protein